MHRATYRYREQSQVDFDGLVQWPILVNILPLKVLANYSVQLDASEPRASNLLIEWETPRNFVLLIVLA